MQAPDIENKDYVMSCGGIIFLFSQLLELLGIGFTQKLKKKDVLTLEDSIPFELSDPIPFRLLPIQEVSLSIINRVTNCLM